MSVFGVILGICLTFDDNKNDCKKNNIKKSNHRVTPENTRNTKTIVMHLSSDPYCRSKVFLKSSPNMVKRLAGLGGLGWTDWVSQNIFVLSTWIYKRHF